MVFYVKITVEICVNCFCRLFKLFDCVFRVVVRDVLVFVLNAYVKAIVNFTNCPVNRAIATNLLSKFSFKNQFFTLSGYFIYRFCRGVCLLKVVSGLTVTLF